jgi:serine/threonine-protein kinase RsbW
MDDAKSNRRHAKHPPAPSPRRRRTSAPDAGTSRLAAGADGASQSLNSNKTLKFEIPSLPEKISDVHRLIIDHVERFGAFDENNLFAIKLALEEALINAAKHGNKHDPHKKVHIEAKVTPRRAEIIIEDEGPGFDRSTVPDPTAEENLCKCSGRGILLMESYMTSVKWSKTGRRVHMVKTADGSSG